MKRYRGLLTIPKLLFRALKSILRPLIFIILHILGFIIDNAIIFVIF